ncbi:hypothetical protein [Lysobacter enzymogenes]|uniref:hypothetical protein n=1 Tax=Lysobacter enzymogenes TaxID=69 RepID=UPI001AF53526|nr:hypothetical protein [Lysobacter enzymogenes]QQQ00959.1 hypothetical protein JHW41_23310 [Lysobacter enzymogenes]
MKFIALACLSILAAGVSSTAYSAESKVSIAESAKRYSNAQSEHERLLACIEAIDKKLICKECELDTVNAIFGTTFSPKDHYRQADDGLSTVEIPLRPSAAALKQQNSLTATPEYSEANPPSATAISGWRLGLTYDSLGKVRMYYLSNAGLRSIGF